MKSLHTNIFTKFDQKSMKKIIITGTTGNLGKAVTTKFLEKGHTIIATITSENSRKELQKHDRMEGVIVDLTNENETSSFIRKTIDKHEKIDAAFMLVGGFAMGNIETTTSRQIHEQIALNFETAYHVARPLLQHMVSKNEGRMVFIGSRPALLAKDGKNMIAYALSKSLLFKLAEYINAEVKGKNISATVIVPSTIDTPANRKSMPDADYGKWVKPEDLAGILDFIISGPATSLRETVLKVYGNG